MIYGFMKTLLNMQKFLRQFKEKIFKLKQINTKKWTKEGSESKINELFRHLAKNIKICLK